MFKVRSSRRVTGLKPGDYDHHIDLLDHDIVSRQSNNSHNSSIEAGDSAAVDPDRSSTNARLLPSVGEGSEEDLPRSSPRLNGQQTNGRLQERTEEELEHERSLPHAALRPSIEVQAPTPGDTFDNPQVVPKKPSDERETAIDILYENERGGFLCGTALFSSAALGSLDPPAWTNAYHNPSPTSIYTAQVPDPSWEWVWSEWHLNIQEGVDEGGWEYSFAFGKKFSWHKGRWYNSFVRRRAWTRKRAKRKEEDISADPHMPNGDYFTIKAAPDRLSHRSVQSLASSRTSSRGTGGTHASNPEMEETKPDIEDIETLLQRLRFARIDREKLQATENYLDHGTDLSDLYGEMHEIMSLFVFQASRRLLLSHLMTIYDDTTKALEKNDTPDLRQRKDALKSALKHADEEVRKLAYWSDVKQMAERGESRGAVDEEKGWPEEWEGVDNSGPAEPNLGKLPGS